MSVSVITVKVASGVTGPRLCWQEESGALQTWMWDFLSIIFLFFHTTLPAPSVSDCSWCLVAFIILWTSLHSSVDPNTASLVFSDTSSFFFLSIFSYLSLIWKRRCQSFPRELHCTSALETIANLINHRGNQSWGKHPFALHWSPFLICSPSHERRREPGNSNATRILYSTCACAVPTFMCMHCRFRRRRKKGDVTIRKVNVISNRDLEDLKLSEFVFSLQISSKLKQQGFAGSKDLQKCSRHFPHGYICFCVYECCLASRRGWQRVRQKSMTDSQCLNMHVQEV